MEPCIRNEEHIDLNVGEQVVKVLTFGGATILGASVASEATDAVVEVLIKFSGKRQQTDMTVDIRDIEINELDGTFDVDRKLFTQDVHDDPAIVSVTDKIAKCEALVLSIANGIITKNTTGTQIITGTIKTKESDEREETTSMAGMLQAQRVECHKFMT